MASGKTRKGLEAICPACGSAIYFRKKPGRGQFVTCGECDSLLVVQRIAPLELEWGFEDPLEVTYRKRDNFEDALGGWDYDEYAGDNDDYDNGRGHRH